MPQDLYAITVTRADASSWSMWELHGRVVLVVALPARQGSTPQTVGVDTLHRTFEGEGLTVVGVPIGEDGVGSGYDVSFPVTRPGEASSALLSWLTAEVADAASEAAPLAKFLVGRDGRPQEWFAADGEAKALIAAVRRALDEPTPDTPPRPVFTTAGRLPVPAPAPDPDADIVDAELVDEQDPSGLERAVEMESIEQDLRQSSEGEQLMDLATDLAVLEAESQLLAERAPQDPS